MLRIPGVILLALCVIVMPSYAAIACGTACTVPAPDTDAQGCCPTSAAAASQTEDDADGDPLSHGSKTPGRQHCAAACCSFVAHVLTAAEPPRGDRPLAGLLPTHSVVRAAIANDAIFHPPRV